MNVSSNNPYDIEVTQSSMSTTYKFSLNGGPTLGIIESGPNMHGWGWTIGFGWNTGLASYNACLNAMLTDPRMGVLA